MAKEPTTSSTGPIVWKDSGLSNTTQDLYRHTGNGRPVYDYPDFIFKKSDYENTFIAVETEGLPDGVTLYLVDENSNQLYSPIDTNANWVTTMCAITVGERNIIPLPAQFVTDLSSYTDFPAGTYNWKLKFNGSDEYIEREIPLDVEIRDFEVWDVLTPQIYPNENVQARLKTYGDTYYPVEAFDAFLSYVLSASATYNENTGIVTYPNADLDVTLGKKVLTVNEASNFAINYEVVNPIIPYIGDAAGENNTDAFAYNQPIYFGIKTEKERTGGFCNASTDNVTTKKVKIETKNSTERDLSLPDLYTDSCPDVVSLPNNYIQNNFPPGTYYYALYGITTRFCTQGYDTKKQFTITTQNCELKITQEDYTHIKSKYLYNGSTPISNAKIGLLKGNNLVKTAITDSNGEILWTVEASGTYKCVAMDKNDDSRLLYSSNSIDVLAASDIIITSDKDILSYMDNDVTTLTAKPVDSSGVGLSGANVIFKKDGIVLADVVTDESGVAQYQYLSSSEGDVTFTIESLFKSKTYNIEDVFLYKTEQEITQEWTKYTDVSDRAIYKTPLMLAPDDNLALEYRYNTTGRAVDGIDLFSENDYTIKLGNVWDRYNDRLQAYCSSSSSSRNQYYGYTSGFNTSSIYKIKLSNNKATWYDNDIAYETNRLIETTSTPRLRHDIFLDNTAHLDYVKLKTDYEILYDDLTKASNYWDVPDNVKAGSQYSSSGWAIHSSNGYQQIKNKFTIPSENVEISFTYMGGYVPSSTINNIIAIFYKENNENTYVGWLHNGTTFVFYPNEKRANYTLKAGDRVVFKYNNGKADIIVNNILIDTYNYTNKSIAGSHFELHTHQDRGITLKDFKIKFRSESSDLFFYDAMTSNSGNWSPPATIQSTYDSNGWQIRTSSNGLTRVPLNKTIPADKFEIKYTYMGGGNTTRQMIEFLQNNTVILGIRYAPSTRLFEVYTGGDAFYTTIGPVDVKVGDVITYKYNQGNIIVEVNNNIAGMCYNNVSNIVNSTLIIVVNYSRWWKLKDFSITTGGG